MTATRRAAQTSVGGAAAGRFNDAYAFALGRYVSSPSESLLRHAYELGREAVQSDLGVLDLAVAHHGAMRRAVDAGEGEAASVVAAAEGFFLEAVSAFEMVQRGFREAQALATQELRQAAILRQLS